MLAASTSVCSTSCFMQLWVVNSTINSRGFQTSVYYVCCYCFWFIHFLFCLYSRQAICARQADDYTTWCILHNCLGHSLSQSIFSLSRTCLMLIHFKEYYETESQYKHIWSQLLTNEVVLESSTKWVSCAALMRAKKSETDALSSVCSCITIL